MIFIFFLPIPWASYQCTSAFRVCPFGSLTFAKPFSFRQRPRPNCFCSRMTSRMPPRRQSFRPPRFLQLSQNTLKISPKDSVAHWHYTVIGSSWGNISKSMKISSIEASNSVLNESTKGTQCPLPNPPPPNPYGGWDGRREEAPLVPGAYP